MWMSFCCSWIFGRLLIFAERRTIKCSVIEDILFGSRNRRHTSQHKQTFLAYCFWKYFINLAYPFHIASRRIWLGIHLHILIDNNREFVSMIEVPIVVVIGIFCLRVIVHIIRLPLVNMHWRNRHAFFSKESEAVVRASKIHFSLPPAIQMKGDFPFRVSYVIGNEIQLCRSYLYL